jgi:hypothetical protein
MKDKEARKKIADIQEQLQVRECSHCQRWTLQHKVVISAIGLVSIPSIIGEIRTCRGDTERWICLNCNKIS